LFRSAERRDDAFSVATQIADDHIELAQGDTETAH